MNPVIEKTFPQTRRLTTEQLIEQLYRTAEKAEIINGRIVKIMPTGDEPSSVAFNIAVSLKNYQKQAFWGRAYSDNAGFLVNLPHRKSFSPDASFYTGERTGMKFLQGAPLFAVEVRSENDYGIKAEREIAEKRDDYFEAGTEIVWDVDLQSENIIKSYHRDSPNEPRIFKRGEIADAEPALSEWKIAVDDLFE